MFSSLKTVIDRHLLKIIVIAIILSAGIALRTLFLTSDPPNNITISGGIIGDPGQYQYAARNQILFGKASLDGYTPQALSPLIHPLNTLVYAWFGVSLTSHRSLPLAFSIAILLCFWYLAHKRLDKTSAVLGTLFMAFSYPLIIYSHVAYREYPMTLFCLLSFWAFAKGANSRKIMPFLQSACWFFLSFLSKGSGIYLLAVFVGVGLIWLIEKRIKWWQLAAFLASMAGFMAVWWYGIFKAYPLMQMLYSRNQSARFSIGFYSLLNNLWQSPMMLVLRSDPVLFLVVIVALFYLLTQRLIRRNALPPIIDLSIAWLACGALFHGIVAYRPTRFYLILVLPAALIAGYGLSFILHNKDILIPKFRHFLGAKLILLPLVMALGFPAYLALVPRWSTFQLAAHLLALTCIMIIFMTKAARSVRKFALALLMIISVSFNLQAFLHWAKQREYEIPAIIEILAKAIPPSRIAGNWASHLSIGTPHRTYYAWINDFNWQADFLERNKIEYLLLARSRNFDEIGDYQGFFSKEWPRVKLMAEFDLQNAKVHLYHLQANMSETQEQKWQLTQEMEAMNRNAGWVRFDALASQKMVVKLPLATSVTFSTRTVVNQAISKIKLRCIGRFSLQIRCGEQILSRVLINVAGPRLQDINRTFPTPLSIQNLPISLRVEPLSPNDTIQLDQIVFSFCPQ